MLEEMGDGGAGQSSQGGNELKVDYFDHLVTVLSKEIQDLLLLCKNVLSLP